MRKIQTDEQLPKTNRQQSQAVSKHKFWYYECDAELVGEMGKCGNCGYRNSRNKKGRQDRRSRK